MEKGTERRTEAEKERGKRAHTDTNVGSGKRKRTVLSILWDEKFPNEQILRKMREADRVKKKGGKRNAAKNTF